MKRLTAPFLALALVLALAPFVQADVFRPAYLELEELGDDRYAMLWKVPSIDERSRLSVYPKLPEAHQPLGPARATRAGTSLYEQSEFLLPGGLAGQSIGFEGIAVGSVQVIARIQWLDGTSSVEALSVEQPVFVVPAADSGGQVAWSYTVLGIEHILEGIDHLLFVLALLLVVRGGRQIILAVTSFTVAHSITLVAATLGWLTVPGPPVEALIALSIVFLASEVVHGLQGRPGLTARAPWVVAFAIGLLHGLGFAGALAEVGLPQTAIPLALFTFNLGVEIGQLMFVAVVLSVLWLIRKLAPRLSEALPAITAYGIGSIAALWTIERIAGF